MVKAEQFEWQFVNDLPKREKSRFRRIWDQLCEFKALTDKHGALLPLSFCAKAAGVSPQRMIQLVDEGRVDHVRFDGHVYLAEESFLDWAKSERKAGRPFKMADDAEKTGSWKTCVKYGREWARETVRGAKK